MDAETRAAHAAHARHVATGEVTTPVVVDRDEWSDIQNLIVALSVDEDAFERIEDLLEPIAKRRYLRDGAEWIDKASQDIRSGDPAPEPVPAPTVDAGPEIDATFAKIREIMEESKPWRNEYELADGDVVREDDRLWNGTKTSEVHHWDGTSVRKARAACGNIGLRFFRKGPAPRAESAPDAREEIEGLIRALAMAAWDEGSDAGVVWCPDADMTKRGVVPMTQEEGLEHSRAHFAEHGAGSPTAPFSIAMHNLRSALAKLEPNP